MTTLDVVFSGSGIRLLSHAGALYALVESGKVKIERLAGTSGGAIIAAAFEAYRKENPDELDCVKKIKDLCFSLDFNDLLKDAWFPLINLVKNNGMYPGQRFQNMVRDKISNKVLGNYPNVSMITAELLDGQVILNAKTNPTMYLSEALRRTMSIPFIFYPRLEGNKCFVDGGISNNFPIDIFNDGKRPTLGIRLFSSTPKKKGVRDLSVFGYASAILSCMMDSIEKEHVDDAIWADVISIDTQTISSFDFGIKETDKYWLFSKGYYTAKKWIEQKDFSKMQIR